MICTFQSHTRPSNPDFSNLSRIWTSSGGISHTPNEGKGQFTSSISEIVSLSKNSPTAIEINANGYLWFQAHAQDGFNPFTVLLDAIGPLNADITLGSDAHAPDSVAKFFPDIISLLKSKNITSASVFNQKKKSLIKLD
jgi:histidinol phosphatase-like PHP family hydrolase